MELNILVVDEYLDNFSDGAIDALKDETGLFANRLVQRSIADETDIRDSNGKSEITSSIVRGAAKHPTVQTKKSTRTKLIISETASTIFGFIAGLMLDSRLLDGEVWYLVISFIVFGIFAVSTACQYMNKE